LGIWQKFAGFAIVQNGFEDAVASRPFGEVATCSMVRIGCLLRLTGRLRILVLQIRMAHFWVRKSVPFGVVHAMVTGCGCSELARQASYLHSGL